MKRQEKPLVQQAATDNKLHKQQSSEREIVPVDQSLGETGVLRGSGGLGWVPSPISNGPVHLDKKGELISTQL